MFATIVTDDEEETFELELEEIDGMPEVVDPVGTEVLALEAAELEDLEAVVEEEVDTEGVAPV